MTWQELGLSMIVLETLETHHMTIRSSGTRRPAAQSTLRLPVARQLPALAGRSVGSQPINAASSLLSTKPTQGFSITIRSRRPEVSSEPCPRCSAPRSPPVLLEGDRHIRAHASDWLLYEVTNLFSHLPRQHRETAAMPRKMCCDCR